MKPQTFQYSGKEGLSRAHALPSIEVVRRQKRGLRYGKPPPKKRTH